MVSGLVTSPCDQLRIFSGDARLIRMESKSAIEVPRSNGLERYKVSSCGCYATAAAPGFLEFLCRSQLHPGSATELRRAAELVGRGGDLLAGAFQSFDQLHIQAERLQFPNQYVERLRHARFNGGLALHDGFVDLGPAKHIVGLCREQFLQNVCRAIGLERPDLHFSETLATELSFSTQRLLGDQRIRSDRASVNLVIHQV